MRYLFAMAVLSAAVLCCGCSKGPPDEDTEDTARGREGYAGQFFAQVPPEGVESPTDPNVFDPAKPPPPPAAPKEITPPEAPPADAVTPPPPPAADDGKASASAGPVGMLPENDTLVLGYRPDGQSVIEVQHSSNYCNAYERFNADYDAMTEEAHQRFGARFKAVVNDAAVCPTFRFQSPDGRWWQLQGYTGLANLCRGYRAAMQPGYEQPASGYLDPPAGSAPCNCNCDCPGCTCRRVAGSGADSINGRILIEGEPALDFSLYEPGSRVAGSCGPGGCSSGPAAGYSGGGMSKKQSRKAARKSCKRGGC